MHIVWMVDLVKITTLNAVFYIKLPQNQIKHSLIYAVKFFTLAKEKRAGAELLSKKCFILYQIFPDLS